MQVHDLTLEDIIDNDESRNIFRNYLIATHNEDPLLFIDAVEQYERMKSHVNRYETAADIIQQFIEPRAKNELNISQLTRSTTLKTFTEQCSRSHCPKHLFDPCSSSVLLELKEDVWPRFVASAYAPQLVKLLNSNHPQPSSTTTTTATTASSTTKSLVDDEELPTTPTSPLTPMSSATTTTTTNESNNESSTPTKSSAATKAFAFNQHELGEESADNNNNNNNGGSSTPTTSDHNDNLLFDSSLSFITEDEFKTLKNWTLSNEALSTSVIKVELVKTVTSKKNTYDVYSSKQWIKFHSYQDSGRFFKIVSHVHGAVEDVMQACLNREYQLATEKSLVDMKHLVYLPLTSNNNNNNSSHNNINKSGGGHSQSGSGGGNHGNRPYACSVNYHRIHMPILTDRDFVTTGTLTCETNVRTKCKRYVLVRKSVPWDTSSLKVKKVVRQDMISCIVFEQMSESNTRTRYHELTWISGSYPSWLWERFIANRGASTHVALQKSVEMHLAAASSSGGGGGNGGMTTTDSCLLLQTWQDRQK